MNLIFANTFEKKLDENRARSAQVSISEHQGAWTVLWSEMDGEAHPVQEIWFEGTPWTDMLDAFRSGVKRKLGEGYVPLIEGIEGRERLRFQGSRRMQTLCYYADVNGNEEAYQALKLWRREVARKENKAAYIVATNRLLQMIAAFTPHQMEELAQIPGMGDSRLNAYGEAILAITQSYPKQVQFPLDWVEAELDEEKFQEWLALQENRREQQENSRLEMKRQLLESLHHGATLAAISDQTSINRRDIVLAVEQLDKEGYDISNWVETELGEISLDELVAAERLFRELGDRYLKPVVSRMYSEEELGKKDVNRVYEWLRLYRLKYRRMAS
ncbi:HRDC domain-containing protein [Gorillibacterium massiliense]|uniref:HRDC domain-containing protein n=1 Tax=Gorillibacterium massiliense TaxID=1280390 RepID=UPI0004B20D82|nr:HRDC domain-containing protein [Gorillibacterium massiliense]